MIICFNRRYVTIWSSIWSFEALYATRGAFAALSDGAVVAWGSEATSRRRKGKGKRSQSEMQN